MAKYSPWLLLVGLTAIAGTGGWLIHRQHQKPAAKKIYQLDLSHLSMPLDGKVDFRFHTLSAWAAVQVPIAYRFDPPMGTENGGLVYNAQPFWEMNTRRGGHHTGDDLNGIGGMNSDLGDPVFSAADGIVIYAGEPSSGWGKILIVAHRLTDGSLLQSMYAHLDAMKVDPGAIVTRGQVIATVGTANGMYPAHLHFEIRASDGADIGAGYGFFVFNRLNPAAVVKDKRHSSAEQISPAVLHLKNQ